MWVNVFVIHWLRERLFEDRIDERLSKVIGERGYRKEAFNGGVCLVKLEGAKTETHTHVKDNIISGNKVHI